MRAACTALTPPRCAPHPTHPPTPLLQNYPSVTYARGPDPQRYLQMYYGDNLCRLVAVKPKYDPTNIMAPEQGVPVSHPGC